MDEGTKKIVLRYIRDNYHLTYNSMINFRVKSLHINNDVSIAQVYEDVIDLFGITNSEATKYFNLWIEEEAIRIDNEQVDKLYMAHEQGVPLSMEDRISVWASMGKVATLRAIHETNSNKYK
jgi:hypothetical protein